MPKTSNNLSLRDATIMDINKIASIIHDNKNDSKEDTFCYKLFEDKIFDFVKLSSLIDNIIQYGQLYKANECYQFSNKEIKDALFWILTSTYKILIYHYNKNDLYKIKTFVNGKEEDAIAYIDTLGLNVYKLFNILE